MNEAGVVNLILIVRVLLVGSILMILPRIMRKGLLFGAYVGEATADRDVARQLLGSWYRGCVVVMVVAILVGLGISAAGQPVAGNLIGTAVLLLGALALYVRVYAKARELAPPTVAEQAAKAAAPLIGGQAQTSAIAKPALIVCIPLSVATFVYAIVSYSGPWPDRSFAAVIFVPSLNLVISPFLALFGLLTANAKRSVRGGLGGGSVEAQNAFRAAMANLFSWTALAFCALMTVLTVQIIRIRMTDATSLGIGTWLMLVVVMVFLAVNMIRIMKRYGQGGALRETGSVEAPLTNGIANNARWVWGLFYVDKDDPSIMVEKRFGIGYTLNYGNRTAVLILAAFVTMSLSVTAFVLIGTFM